jgi:solute carrier family 44 (choline transporter-like protein), member 2/4/5
LDLLFISVIISIFNLLLIFTIEISLFLIAFREGDLDRILVPRDTDGLQCGKDSEVVDKKFLVFFDLAKCADPLVPINGCPTTQTCVKQCPNETFVHNFDICRREGVGNYRRKLICSRKINVANINSCEKVQEHIDREECAKWYLKSESCKFFKVISNSQF